MAVALTASAALAHGWTTQEDDARPQTKLDRGLGNGMGVAVGRLRDEALFSYRFVCLLHNTLRGAVGGLCLRLSCSRRTAI